MGTYQPCIETAFEHEGVRVRADILERLPRGRWRLIEGKSSTALKDYYVYDMAIQRHVLKGCGLDIVPYVVHLNDQDLLKLLDAGAAGSGARRASGDRTGTPVYESDHLRIL